MKKQSVFKILLYVLVFAVIQGVADKSACAQQPGTLIGMQYETFFTPHNVGSWETAEAIPVMGKYSSYDVNVIKKHEEWFEYLGVDWLLIDWSNMLWTTPVWEEHQGATKEIEETTELLFRTYGELEEEGKHPPKLVIMLGLQNGVPVPNALERLNGVVAWTKKHFLDKPEYKNRWLYYEGKPLLTILYHVNYSCEEIGRNTANLIASDWTIRWMGSQLQETRVDKCGFWSWMDGPIRQIVTYRRGSAEQVVVTPASFPPPRFWLDPRAVGRKHGASYLESWKVAFEARPRFIQIHQWNEFAGQQEGEGGGPLHDIYGDEYNLELSDDIEPTQLDKCGYRGCGGWGYYYMNMTKALISVYRGEAADITVMAVSTPNGKTPIKDSQLKLKWEVVGRRPASYTVMLDGKQIAVDVAESEWTLNLAGLARGEHRARIIANGAHTYFDLRPDRLTERSSRPLPVISDLDFTYVPH